MHPILARGRFLALYLGICVLVGGLLGAMLVAQAALTWAEALLVALPLAAVYAFVCLSGWYVSRGMPLVATSAVRILATALTSAVISSTVWLLVARLWMTALVARGWVKASAYGAPGLDALVFSLGVLLYLLSLAVSYLLAGFEQLRETERRRLQLQVLAREAELRSLRAQIDPHFLFNSLHSISALTASDPAAARRMCLLLADFLRDSLALGGEERITLERELALVERFLTIERIRFGNRLAVEIDGRDAAQCLVPPLLLQPLVENAVTHGIAHVLEGGTIRVAASRGARRLTILVENPCDADRPRGRGAGVGIANVRARLGALHGTEARLDATEQNGLWRVELTMPALPSAER
jgi:sensor histidine kinase YesM